MLSHYSPAETIQLELISREQIVATKMFREASEGVDDPELHNLMLEGMQAFNARQARRILGEKPEGMNYMDVDTRKAVLFAEQWVKSGKR